MLDKEGKQVAYGAKGLEALTDITDEHVLPELKEATFIIACDVTNPLCGKEGCSAIFGPQKGASHEMILKMDQWLLHYANLAKAKYPHADAKRKGAGAAGGLGFAFSTFLNGTLRSGIQIVLEETKLEEEIKDADLVITGEGRLDEQTVMGKAPIGVARLAKKYQLPVWGFSGCVTEGAKGCNEAGIDAFFPILRNVVSLEEAMQTEQAIRHLADTVEQVARAVKSIKA